MSDLIIELQETFEKTFGYLPDADYCIEYVMLTGDTDADRFNDWCIKNFRL